MSLQSHSEVLNTLDSAPGFDPRHATTPDASSKIFVASVSPQVRASLAATYGISERRAGYMIEQFLSGPQGLAAGGKYGNGFGFVVDTNVMREACLVLGADEVAQSQSPDSPKRPIVTSACPGWICYAEKTHPHVLPHLSRLKSPQALTGTFLKTVLGKIYGVSPSQIWHLAIMPCFDKKLEASRSELTNTAWQDTTSDPVRDVDCVITSRELLMLAESRSISLPTLATTALQPISFPDSKISSFLFSQFPPSQTGDHASTGPSGGYLSHILEHESSLHPGSTIITTRGRNADVIEYSILSADQKTTLFKAARYYGFRNIQNLVRKLQPARVSRMPGAVRGRAAAAAKGNSASEYGYIEVMACPGGCTNGGGQIRIEDVKEMMAKQATAAASQEDTETTTSAIQPAKATIHEQRDWLAKVDEAYFSSSDSEQNQATSPPPSSYSASVTSAEYSDPDTDMEIDDVPKPALPAAELQTPASQSERIHKMILYWSELTSIPVDKLVYTTYRAVESDVGKKKKSGGDTAHVVELAGKIGGGW